MNKEIISRFPPLKTWKLSPHWWRYETKIRLLKVFTIAGVLLSSGFIAQFFPAKYLVLIIIIIAAFLGLILFLKIPFIGLIVVIAGGLLINFEVGTSTSTSLNLAVILLPVFIGIWFADQVIRNRKFQFVRSRANPPLVAFVLITIFAFGIGQLTWFFYARQAPLISQLGGLAIFLLSFGAFIFSENILDEEKYLKYLVIIFLLIGSVIVVSRMSVSISSFIPYVFPRGAAGSVFWIWLLAIAYSQLLYNRDLNIILRGLLLGLIAATLFVAIYKGYGWKSGWIPALVGMGVITWFRFRRLRYLLAFGGVIVVWLMASELIQSDQYSYVTRIEAWKILLNEIIKVNPVFGLGPANYRFYTPLFPIMGYWVEFNSHNNYIDIIAQIGVLGLIAFLWFAWEVWRVGWSLLKRNLGGFGNAYVVGAMGGLVGMLVAGMLGDWVIPFVYNVGLKGFRASVLGWIFLGGLVALQQIYSTNQKVGDKESD